MSYLTQSQANRPAAIAGVVAVHAGLAAILLTGLAIKDVIKSEPEILVGYDLPDPPPPEPQPEPKVQPEPMAQPMPVPTPKPIIDLVTDSPIELVVNDFPPIVDTVPVSLPPVDTGTGKFQAIEPAVATPRNDPGRWVTDADYRSRWIREERFGTASFRLEITSRGRVSDCMITKSTGHSVLDQATCNLISKRARFNPAQDASGANIGGIYESSIRWVLPD